MNAFRCAVPVALLAAGVVHAQSLDAAAAAAPAVNAAARAPVEVPAPPSVLVAPPEPALAASPLRARPFAAVQPVARGYMGNDIEPDGLGVFENKAFLGVWRTDPRLYAGVNLVPGLSVETGYRNLFDRGRFLAGVEHPEDAAGALGVKGFNSYLAAKYSLTVADRFEAYGRVGTAYSERIGREAARGPTVGDTDVGPYAGVGAKYRLTDKVSVNAQYEHYGDSAKKWGAETNNSGLRAKVNVGF